MVEIMSNWFEEKEKRERASLDKHYRLSKLFKEDRFSFEKERKKMIEELINSNSDEDTKDHLWKLQAAWDKKMKGSASPHNRFILAQTFFWNHFHEVWAPTIKTVNRSLNQKPVKKRLRIV